MKNTRLSSAVCITKKILRGDLTNFLFHRQASVKTEQVRKRVLLGQVIEYAKKYCKGVFDHSGPHESAVYFTQGNSCVCVCGGGGQGGERDPKF